MGKEVADADGADSFCVVEFFKGLPGAGVELLPVMVMPFGNGPGDQIQIQITNIQLLHGLLKISHGGIIALVGVPYLAGDKKLLSGDAALPDPPAHAYLVLIKCGSVNVTVTYLYGVFDGLTGILVGEQPGSKADAGDFYAVGEGITIVQAFQLGCPFFILFNQDRWCPDVVPGGRWFPES